MNSIDDSIIPQCEGIPRQKWSGKYLVLHNASGVIIVERICRNVSFDVVIGSSSPLRDTHVAVQISSTLSEDNLVDKWRYSIQAWPIELVYCNGANF